MITLFIALVVLVVVVAFIVKPLLAAINAPSWAYTVVVGIAIIIAIYLVAGAFGFQTPQLN